MSKIPSEVRKLLENGFKPFGAAIPNPVNAPRGSAVYSFRKRAGRKVQHVSLVLDPRGRVVRKSA